MVLGLGRRDTPASLEWGGEAVGPSRLLVRTDNQIRIRTRICPPLLYLVSDGLKNTDREGGEG